MENLSSAAELKEAIQLLETEQAFYLEQSKEKLQLIHESFTPANLIKSTINEIASSPYLTNNVIDTAIGLTAGYISRKAIVKESAGIFKKLLGVILQVGVTNLVAQNPESIKLFGKFIIQHIFPKKKINSIDP